MAVRHLVSTRRLIRPSHMARTEDIASTRGWDTSATGVVVIGMNEVLFTMIVADKPLAARLIWLDKSIDDMLNELVSVIWWTPRSSATSKPVISTAVPTRRTPLAL